MKRCLCGSTVFNAHQRCYHDVTVDETGAFLEDKGIYQSETPYGPFTCVVCQREYDEIGNLPTFIDAQEMAKLHPKTFSAPTLEEVKKVKVGDFVKVCVDNLERFWVEVTEISEDRIQGKISNDLLHFDNMKFGDVISFESRHVYDIMEKE